MPEPIDRGWSRAFGPGSGRLRSLIAVGVALALVAGSLGVFLTRDDGAASAAPRFGQLPDWLPKARVPVGRIVQASAAHPRLAIEGDALLVRLSHGRALVTTVGPEVPEDGQFPVPATSPCSFVVTFAAASGAVPLRAGAFTILDELGRVHHPDVTALHGGPPPAEVPPGRTVTLRMNGVLPTGNGRLRWAPEGARPIASWDFDVEID